MAVPKVGIPKPKGSETVTFTQDIAPILVNNCVRCHSGNDPKGGLSMETFELLWAGGKSGPVIAPGSTRQEPIVAVGRRTKAVQDAAG